MANRFQVAAIAAVVMVIGSAAQAQQNVCQANIAQVLSEYGVKFGDVVNPTWQTLRWAHHGDANGPVNGTASRPPARAAVFTFRSRPAAKSPICTPMAVA